ncbi:hypothetical protein H9P43_005080 [Blastocladiella emersonii ATCC 22665]|nr:hypothetical protein H9P43_005080 [Blastocladiella emersonii ATCC 22665]
MDHTHAPSANLPLAPATAPPAQPRPAPAAASRKRKQEVAVAVSEDGTVDASAESADDPLLSPQLNPETVFAELDVVVLPNPTPWLWIPNDVSLILSNEASAAVAAAGSSTAAAVKQEGEEDGDAAQSPTDAAAPESDPEDDGDHDDDDDDDEDERPAKRRATSNARLSAAAATSSSTRSGKVKAESRAASPDAAAAEPVAETYSKPPQRLKYTLGALMARTTVRADAPKQPVWYFRLVPYHPAPSLATDPFLARVRAHLESLNAAQGWTGPEHADIKWTIDDGAHVVFVVEEVRRRTQTAHIVPDRDGRMWSFAPEYHSIKVDDTPGAPSKRVVVIPQIDLDEAAALTKYWAKGEKG